MTLRDAALAILLLPCASACHSSGSATPPPTTNDASLPPFDAGPPPDAALSFDWTALDQEAFGGAWQTEGLVVMQAGRVVHEHYAAGWTADMPHLLYSASKSVGSALVGIAEGQGLLHRTDSVCKYMTPPTGADPSLCDTTIEDLLHMSSGLTWAEDYGSTGDPTQSNVLQMLYGDQADMGAYAAAQPRAAAAGATFNYSSGDANVMGLVLKGALKGDASAWAKANLFDPVGMASTLCELDRAGTIVFSSWCFMTTRDFAKLGQLYLDDGVVNGARALPVGWVTYSTTPAPAVSVPASRLLDAGAGPGGSYGAMWWLNAATKTSGSDTWEYPGEPVDGYSAEGHYGQKLFVVPSRRLVVARVGNDRDPELDPNGLIAAAVAAVDAALGTGRGDQ
jgi:CubicO group peptidase (beta-lactamase class C family)